MFWQPEFGLVDSVRKDHQCLGGVVAAEFIEAPLYGAINELIMKVLTQCFDGSQLHF